MSVGGEPAGSVRIVAGTRGERAWFGQKAPWIAGPRYRGPVLIRGARIDGPGQARFARTTGQHLRELYQARGAGVQPNGWRAWPALLLVHSTGCYGLQVDGTSFSEIIVIRVRG